MKIGILYCGYNQLDNVKNTLEFWNNLEIEGIEIIVCNVSVPFLEYKDMGIEEDGTIDYIKNMQKKNIKHSVYEPRFVKERIARDHAMLFLTKSNIDYLWQVDSDEYYTVDNVKNIVNYLKTSNNLVHSVNFKNYIFDGTYYLDDFCVPKINKVSGENILSFYDDNQIIYHKYGLVRSSPIPKSIAWVKHMTWMHKGGKEKVRYQLKHFGDCSYKWNDTKNELELDLDYYKRHGYTVPNIMREQ